MQRFLDSIAFSQPYLVGLLFMVMVMLFMPGCATAGADSAVRNADIVLQLNTSAAFRARRFVQGSSTT